MSVFIDPDRLLQGMGRSLRRQVLPALEPGSPRFTAQAVAELLVHMAHRRSSPLPPPEPHRAEAMAAEIARLTRGTTGPEAAERLVALLHEDSRFYREDDARYRALLAQLGEGEQQLFEPPTEAALTIVLRRFTGDPAAQARLMGRAVGGYSKQTIFFDHVSDGEVVQQLVMRRDLPFAAADRSSVTDEYPVLRLMHAAGYPVAEPLFVEADPAVLETPFLISRRVPGRLYGDSLGLHETPDFDPPTIFGTLLAKLHAVDLAGAGLPGISDVATDLAAQVAKIDGWIDVYRRHIDVPSAALELGLAWLRANARLVADGRALVHGDIGYHNILFHDGRVSALVDWELVHAGHPAEDISYVMSFIEQPDALLDRYVEAGGTRPSDGALTYCRIFGNLRNAIYGVVGMHQFNHGMHDDVSMLPIILSSYSSYVVALDDMLAKTITDHGFHWEIAP